MVNFLSKWGKQASAIRALSILKPAKTRSRSLRHLDPLHFDEVWEEKKKHTKQKKKVTRDERIQFFILCPGRFFFVFRDEPPPCSWAFPDMPGKTTKWNRPSLTESKWTTSCEEEEELAWKAAPSPPPKKKHAIFPRWWLNHPFQKYARQIGSFPQVGVKIPKNIWNHHPESQSSLRCWNMEQRFALENGVSSPCYGEY